MNDLHVSGDNYEDRIGKHMSAVQDTTHRANSMQHYFYQKTIDGGSNNNESIDLSYILNRNIIINVVNIITFKYLQTIRHFCISY